MRDIEALTSLAYLDELRMNDMRAPVDLAPVRSMPSLRGLRVVGTKFVGLDESDLGRLLRVGLAVRDSPLQKRLDAVLRAKGGGASVQDGDWERGLASRMAAFRQLAAMHELDVEQPETLFG